MIVESNEMLQPLVISLLHKLLFGLCIVGPSLNGEEEGERVFTMAVYSSGRVKGLCNLLN